MLFASDSSSNSQPLLDASWLGSNHHFCLQQAADQGLPSTYCKSCLAGAAWLTGEVLLMVSQQLLQQESKGAQNLCWGLSTSSGVVLCGLQHQVKQVALAHQGSWLKQHSWAQLSLQEDPGAQPWGWEQWFPPLWEVCCYCGIHLPGERAVRRSEHARHQAG